MIALTLALVCAAEKITIEVPSLAASESRLVALAEWGSLADPEIAPARLRQYIMGSFGVDPLSSASLRAAGVDPGKPIRATYERRQIVVEVSLGDLDKARAHLAKIQKGAPSLSDATGFVTGDAPISTLAAIISGKRVIAVLGLDRSPSFVRTATRSAKAPSLAKDPRLELARRVIAGKERVEPGKSLRASPHDLWAVFSSKGDIERIDAVVHAPRDIFIEAEALLGMGAEVALNEMVRGRANAKRRVDAGPIALEVNTALTKAGMRALLNRGRYPTAWVNSFAGPIQLGMAADGTLYAAAELDPKAPPLDTKSLGPEVLVEQKDGALWARLGSTPLTSARTSSVTRGAIAIDVAPMAVLGAIGKHKERLGVRPMELMMAQLLVGKVLGATERVRIDVSLPTNRARASIAITRRPL